MVLTLYNIILLKYYKLHYFRCPLKNVRTICLELMIYNLTIIRVADNILSHLSRQTAN